MQEKIAVIEHNDVQTELYKLLVQNGIICEKINLINTPLTKEYMKGFDKIVLPFPSKKQNISFLSEKDVSISDFFSKAQTVIGGMIDENIKKELSGAEIEFFDYFETESYVLKNAYITAQGVLRLLFENTKGIITGKTALVTGFGRIGESLAVMLKNLGLKVFVAVRSNIQTAKASSMGFDVIKISQIKSSVFYFDFIFNTVPFTVFSKNDVKHIKDTAVYFEIASSPFGAEKDDFITADKKHIQASALPGKLYPQAVAENIYEFITEISEGGRR